MHFDADMDSFAWMQRYNFFFMFLDFLPLAAFIYSVQKGEGAHRESGGIHAKRGQRLGVKPTNTAGGQ